MSVYENLKEHGIELPKQLAAAGLYKPVNQAGNLVFIMPSLRFRFRITGSARPSASWMSGNGIM